MTMTTTNIGFGATATAADAYRAAEKAYRAAADAAYSADLAARRAAKAKAAAGAAMLEAAIAAEAEASANLAEAKALGGSTGDLPARLDRAFYDRVAAQDVAGTGR